jgi:AcrR family transcriptional regulator
VSRPLHRLADPETLDAERRALIDAALGLLEEAGTVDVHVADVVRRSGGHNAAFYRIFGSKDDLVLAVVEEAVGRTAAVLERRMAEAEGPADAVRAWVAVLLGRAATARAAAATQPFALDRHRLMHRFPGVYDRLNRPLRLALSRVLRSAGCAHPDIAAEAAFELVMSRQASWIAEGHRPSPREIGVYAQLVVDLVGLG